jgi:hypothetical protein
MHRPTVGFIAIALAIGGLVLRAYFPDDAYVRDACWRPGLVMGLLWLALPQLVQLPRWMMISLLVSGLLVMWRPRVVLLALPLLAVMWFLRPRRSRRPTIS